MSRFAKEIEICDHELESVMNAEARIPFDPGSIEQHIAAAGLSNCRPWDRAITRRNENQMQQHLEEVMNMHAPLNQDGSYHYLTEDDLPEIGRGDHPYKITSTGDMFRFRADRYVSFNPYGATPSDLQAPTIFITPDRQTPNEIVDESASMPSGGEGPLKVVWNVHALRRDLWAKGVRDWSYADMMPAGERWRIQPGTPLDRQRSLYFCYSHRALRDQLLTHLRVRGEFQKDYVEALERLGVEVWYEDGRYGFRDDEFSVTFE